LPRSHAEKNLGVSSITTSTPFLVFSTIILASGCSIVPRYFMFILSTIGKFFCISSDIFATALPFTPLYGKFSSSIEK
jgi:hypothetical protein